MRRPNQGTVRDIAEYDAATGDITIANHHQYNAFGAITSETAGAADFL
ncbi:MAG: hypothetical protein KY475_17010 [Planctomycetes bacterium]|nr:hypothetical protein [Planctomycetota bacterium]